MLFYDKNGLNLDPDDVKYHWSDLNSILRLCSAEIRVVEGVTGWGVISACRRTFLSMIDKKMS